MRRDTQIGVILGMVILVIIGVFLSTRTSDNGSVLPDLVLEEEYKQNPVIEEIEISAIIEKSEIAEQEEVPTVEFPSFEVRVSDKIVKPIQPEEQLAKTFVEIPDDDTSLEGKWEGIAEEISENSEIAQRIPSEEKTFIPEKEQQISSYSISNNTVYKVRPNDSLIKISRKYYGNEKKWTRIFDANRDSMSDPNALYVGQKLLIPDITVDKESNETIQAPVINKRKYLDKNTHTVEAGDTLYRLAEKYFDDPSVWMDIYEANEDTIEDKGLLKEGQILIIPKR